MTRPDWVVPGAEVLTYRKYCKPDLTNHKVTTIDRVLKRDVVLANGERYNADILERREGGSFGDTRAVIPLDSDQARKVIADYREYLVGYRARLACDEFARNRGGTRGYTAEEVILALAPLTEHAAEIRSLLKPARPGSQT